MLLEPSQTVQSAAHIRSQYSLAVKPFAWEKATSTKVSVTALRAKRPCFQLPSGLTHLIQAMSGTTSSSNKLDWGPQGAALNLQQGSLSSGRKETPVSINTVSHIPR